MIVLDVAAKLRTGKFVKRHVKYATRLSGDERFKCTQLSAVLTLSFLLFLYFERNFYQLFLFETSSIFSIKSITFQRYQQDVKAI